MRFISLPSWYPVTWMEAVMEYALQQFPDRTGAISYDQCAAAIPFLVEAYPHLAAELGTQFDVSLTTRERQYGSVNINVLHGHGAGCASHTDDNTHTLLLYPHDITSATGGALVLAGQSYHPQKGQAFFFAGGQISHAVAPLVSGFRVSVLYAFQQTGVPDTPVMDYLHGRTI